MFKSQEKSDIEQYYVRTRQGKYGNSYYIEPSQTCPLDVLQDRKRFIVLTFDKKDGYVVVGGRRYYLNKTNSIKCTDKIDRRVAVVDLKALKAAKSYDYQPTYHHQHTLEVNSFATLEAEAERQYSFNGAPYVKQVAHYDVNTNKYSYVYEPSFQVA